MLAIRRVNKHAAFFLIDTRNLTHNYGCVLLFPQYSPNRRAHLPGSEHRCRHLIKQRLKQMMIRPINKNDLDGGLSKGFRRGQAAEPAADDHYAGCVTGAGVIVCHIWFWFPFFLKLSGAEISQILKIRSPAEVRSCY